MRVTVRTAIGLDQDTIKGRGGTPLRFSVFVQLIRRMFAPVVFHTDPKHCGTSSRCLFDHHVCVARMRACQA